MNLSNSNKDLEMFKIMRRTSAYQSSQNCIVVVETVIDPNQESTKI